MDALAITRSFALFVVAAALEIGGAWLVWQAVREGRGWALALLGGLALFLYGFVATFQTDSVAAPRATGSAGPAQPCS